MLNQETFYRDLFGIVYRTFNNGHRRFCKVRSSIDSHKRTVYGKLSLHIPKDLRVE